MRIGINALAAENRSGTGRYTTELIRALAEIDTDNEYGIVAHEDSPLCELIEGRSNFRLLRQKRRERVLRILWERWKLPGLIARERFDVFHAPAFVLPSRSTAATVATIHDLVFMRYPETFGYMRRNYFQWAIPGSAYRADRVIADSEATRRDLEDLLGVRDDKIHVIPLGIGREFFEPPSEEAVERVRADLQLPEEYILTVGTIEPRKNLIRLLEAYAQVKAGMGRHSPALVLVGRKGWKYSEVFGEILERGLQDDVIWTDFLPDEAVRALYAHAMVFAYVSLHEGFGLPLLEAMATGTAVVASNCSSMPEVVGNAGRLVDPFSPDSIAKGILDVVGDPQFRGKLAAKARERAGRFTWGNTARQTLEVYRDAANASRG
jgi:glycosyltransferase involved in cell wall biosynthesis